MFFSFFHPVIPIRFKQEEIEHFFYTEAQAKQLAVDTSLRPFASSSEDKKSFSNCGVPSDGRHSQGILLVLLSSSGNFPQIHARGGFL